MQIRLRGALLLAGCALFYAMLFTTLLLNGLESRSGAVPAILLTLLLVGVPGVIALIGLLELLTGIAFTDLSGRWSLLTGTRRTLFGLLLAGLALLLTLVGVLLQRWLSI